MDVDDPIVEEIPVYLSKNLTPDLYVIQFPINNKKYDLDQSNIINCCFKPKSQQIKIDYGLATDSKHYDAFKGDQLAKTADGNHRGGGGGGPSTSRATEDKNDRPTFSSGRMDKMTFVSSVAVDNPRYAVGQIIDGELHLAPIKTFFQMRQPFAYFDKGDKRNKAEKDDRDVEEVEEEMKAVTVKFAKTTDSDRVKKAKEKSFYHFSQIGKDEPWCETMVYPSTSHQAEIERKKFPYHSTATDVPHFVNIPAQEYFHQLINTDAYALDVTQSQSLSQDAVNKTEEKTNVSQQTAELRGVFSKRQVKKMPLLDQLKIILRDAKVMSFSSLMDIVSSPQVTVEKVLRNLALCGVLVRGNWTLQSEILYPCTFKSLINGISAELMCQGRDYVLYKISQMNSLNRSRLMEVTQLPNEETREILESVAYLTWKHDDCGNKKAVWDLLKPHDFDFEKRYPEICQRQEALWKAQEKKFLEMEQEKNEKRKRTRSVREIKVEK